nr:unnamed protein product [Callosobruchus analis]
MAGTRDLCKVEEDVAYNLQHVFVFIRHVLLHLRSPSSQLYHTGSITAVNAISSVYLQISSYKDL